jgi:hypothetical protein
MYQERSIMWTAQTCLWERGQSQPQPFVDRNEKLSKLASIGRLERRKIQTITSWDLATLTGSSNHAVNNSMCFRTTNGGLNLDETRKQLRQKGADGVGKLMML